MKSSELLERATSLRTKWTRGVMAYDDVIAELGVEFKMAEYALEIAWAESEGILSHDRAVWALSIVVEWNDDKANVIYGYMSGLHDMGCNVGEIRYYIELLRDLHHCE